MGENATSRANGRASATITSMASGANLEAVRRMLDGMDVIEARRAAMIGGAAAIGMLVGVAAVRNLRS